MWFNLYPAFNVLVTAARMEVISVIHPVVGTMEVLIELKATISTIGLWTINP
jgi:hypothetical protein